MLPLIRDHLDQITAVCRRYGVKRLEIFGSAARGDFRPGESDIDFFVEFDSYTTPDIADRWFGLQEELQQTLSANIDLVSARSATNPYFLEVASRSRMTVYAA